MADTLTPAPSAPAPARPRTVVQIVDEQVARGERTLTPMGRAILEARRQVERNGLPLLTREELDRERAERRGGVESR